LNEKCCYHNSTFAKTFLADYFFLVGGRHLSIIGMSPPTLHKYLAAHELLMLTCREKIKKKGAGQKFSKISNMRSDDAVQEARF